MPSALPLEAVKFVTKGRTHGAGNINDSTMVGNRVGYLIKVAMQPCQFQSDGNFIGISAK
jgi:hypothetical protein